MPNDRVHSLRDWSLITGRGATKREEGHVKFYPYEMGGGGIFLAMLNGGHRVVFMR